MKTQVHLDDLCSNPSEQSRNLATVSNPEDRPAPSFDDLFEDPDQMLASQPPQMSSPASNVNVIDVSSSSVDESAVKVVNEPVEREVNAPEFVAPMEEFNSGFMAPVIDDAPVSVPTSSGGRLYRSSGAEGPAAAVAIPALDRGPVRISTDPTLAPRPDLPPSVAADPSPDFDAGVAPVQPRPSAYANQPDAASDEELDRPADSPRRALRTAPEPAGLTYNGAAVVILAATVLVGFIDAILNHKLGWLTGLALIASSIYAALNVRLPDAWAPAILAPLGFMAATLTAGQLTRGSSGSWLVREGYMIFRSLAVNAPWIIGATVICAAIAFWRKRSA